MWITLLPSKKGIATLFLVKLEVLFPPNAAKVDIIAGLDVSAPLKRGQSKGNISAKSDTKMPKN